MEAGIDVSSHRPEGGRGDPGWPAAQRHLGAGIDFDRANAARVYDYFLGGAHNFAVDRELAARVTEQHPEFTAVIRANRAFLGRVVEWCTAAGIDQFLDLGSGVPTVGNVHEIARRRLPTARVAYVDFEPVAHAQHLLAGTEQVTITRADLRDPDSVLSAPGVAGLLDFSRPVALLAIAVLHFVDGALAPMLAHYRSVMAPGSVLGISHASDDHDDPTVAAHARAVAATYTDSATPLTLRSRAEIRSLLAGLELVEPGLVDVRDWPHPHPEDPGAGGYGALARPRSGASTSPVRSAALL